MLLKSIKPLSLFFVLICLAGVLAACGQNVSPTSNANKASSSPTLTPTLLKPTNVPATVTMVNTPNAASTLTKANTAISTINPTASVNKTVLPSPTPLASDSLRSYLDNNYQFGIVYPSDWKVTRTPGRILFTSSVSQTYGVSVDIAPEQSQNVQQELQAYLTDFLKRNPDTAISNPSVGLGWGGITSYGAFINFPPDPAKPDTRVKAYVEKVYNDGVMYTLIASSEQSHYTERETLLQICLNSFLPLELTQAGKNQTDTSAFTDFGTKFNYPKDWLVDKKTIDAGTVLTIANSSLPDVNLVMQIATGTDPEKYNSEVFDEIQKGATDFNSIEYRPLKLSETQQISRWVVLFVSGKGLPIYRYIYTISDSKTGLLYSLQASAFSTHYLQYSDALMAALQSFSVN